MLTLDDAALNVVMDACRPLEPERRSAFLEALARPHRRIGAGAVARLVRELQKNHWSAPDPDRRRRFNPAVGIRWLWRRLQRRKLRSWKLPFTLRMVAITAAGIDSLGRLEKRL